MRRSGEHPPPGDRPWAGFAPTLAWVGLGLFALGAGLGAARLVTGLPAFGVAMAGAALSVVALVGALVAALRGRRARAMRAGLVALIAPAVVAGAWLHHGEAPPINDATTDLGDPPLIANAPPISPEVAALHAQAYTDLAPLILERPPSSVLAAVIAAIDADRGLERVGVDPTAGLVHAIARSGVFGFVDDVTVRVTTTPEGASRVDVRSRSREGRGDFGVNARRVRALRSALDR